MNSHDSERIKGMLESLGLGEATSKEEADVVIFNTCTIREKPDTKLSAYLGDAGAHEIATLPEAEARERIVVRTRRYAASQRKWMRRIPGLVSVDGTRSPEEVADAVLEVARARQ